MVSKQPDGDDFLSDVLWRISQRVQIETVILLEIENEVRADWAGERPYIAKDREHMHSIISARNGRIFSDWNHGEREPLLARRYGVTVRRIRQVIHEELAKRKAGK